jgi:hypothetical protein
MKKSLLETNPYLKDAAKRTRALTRNIETSSAIEGILVKRDAKSGQFVSLKKSIKSSGKATKTSR